MTQSKTFSSADFAAWGRKGGLRRAKTRTPAELSALAKRAWRKRKLQRKRNGAKR